MNSKTTCAAFIFLALVVAIVDVHIMLRLYIWISAHTELVRSLTETLWNATEAEA